MSKMIYYRDLNTISGSSERFRTQVGGFYTPYSASMGEGLLFTPMKSSDSPSLSHGLSPMIKSIEQKGTPADGMVEYLGGEKYSQGIIVPAIRFPIRIHGNEQNIKNDTHWATFLSGGTFGGVDFTGVYNNNTYDTYSICYEGPHSMEEVHVLDKGGTWSGIYQETSIQPRMRNYYSEYYRHVSELDSVRIVPNMYMLLAQSAVASYLYGDGGSLETYETARKQFFSNDFFKFCDLGGNVSEEELKNLFAKEEVSIPAGSDEDTPTDGFPYSPEDEFYEYEHDKFTTLYTDVAPALKTYLTESLLLHPHSASVLEYADSQFKNIFFGGESYPQWEYYTHTDTAMAVMPIAVEIKMQNVPTMYADADESSWAAFPGPLNRSISHRNSSTLILKKIKETLAGEIEANQVGFRTVPVVCTEHYQTASLNDLNVREVETSKIKNVKMIDYVKLLTYAYQNYSTSTEDCFFMNSLMDEEAVVARDESGTQRYNSTKCVYNTLKDLVGYLNDSEAGNVQDLQKIYNMGGQGYEGGFGTETFAYRIEKIGGSPTGDTLTQNTLQNIWIYNCPSNLGSSGYASIDKVRTYLDTQVRYGETYTYNVYVYMLTIGAKYKFTDLAITRQIGSYSSFSGPFGIEIGVDSEYSEYALDAMGATPKNCLEFYNPITNEATPQLFETESNLNNDFGTNAQISSEEKYLADFYLNYEPSVQIVEVPLVSKTIQITDNPPTNLTVYPFQELNDKDTIGFYLDYETKSAEPYPFSLTDAEEKMKTDYLKAYDLPEGSDITMESCSKATTIQVYRLDRKPKSYRDFEKALHQSIDLRKTGTKYTFPDAYFYDKIKTNTKYYYAFRVMNALGVHGPLTEIYEVQLVDDGGYKYSLFETLFEESLVEETYVEPSKTLKKIFQLQPNLSHMVFNTQDVDFNGSATEGTNNLIVGGAGDSIWDQTFKIRLTSKKTGKKLDLNVTYNIKEE